MLGPRGHDVGNAFGPADLLRKRDPERGRQDDAVSGVHQRKQRMQDGLLGAHRRQDGVVTVLEGVVALKVTPDRKVQLSRALNVGVARFTGLNRAAPPPL